jgi:YD repeat-containing protein
MACPMIRKPLLTNINSSTHQNKFMKLIPFSWLYLLLIALGFVACRKNPDLNPPSPQPDVQSKLFRIKTGNSFTTFTYNGEGKLTGIADSIAGGTYPSTHTKLEYNGARLVKTTYGHMTYQYEYPDNNTVVVNTGSLSNPVLDKDVFRYEGNRLVEHIRYYAPGNEPNLRHVYTYNSAGNVEKEEEFAYDPQARQWNKIATGISTYDDKENGTTWLEERQYFFMEPNKARLKNNPVKTEWYLPNNQLLRTHRYQYTYDAKGRKLSRIEEVVVNNRVTNTITTQFSYQ